MVNVRALNLQNDNEDSMPQAIFWRPIVYFSSCIVDGHDELDEFKAAYFCIGNHLNFSLKKYNGYPDYTSTLYIPLRLEGNELTSAIDEVIAGFKLPASSIGWRRGQAFEFGELPRSNRDRLRENEARLLVLKIAALCDDLTATTSYIKRRIPEFFPLSAADRKLSETRSREELWRQIVGNVKVHGDGGRGIFRNGYASPTARGLTVTEKGLDYLRSIGFHV